MRPGPIALAALFTVGLPRAVLACPVCFGESDAPLAQAMNLGIVAMLAIIISVLSGFAAFILYLARRARLVQALPDHSGAAGLSGHPGSGS
jgi:hypothetical protein